MKNIASHAPLAAEIARFAAAAARRPRLFRWHLTVLAVLADVLLMVLRVLPIVAPALLGAVFIDWAPLPWLVAALSLFLMWVLRPTARMRGRELTQAEAPRLYAEIATLQRQVGMSGPVRVQLNFECNASAFESRGILGLLGTQRILTLGVPLLTMLGREQVLAVVAHEFGHFSHRHGRLGHWLYRAREGWQQWASPWVSDDNLDRSITWLARRILPLFEARSFVHAQKCEFEADADAARAVGAACFASALVRVDVIATLWAQQESLCCTQWQTELAEPPSDYSVRLATTVRALEPTSQTLLAKSLETKTAYPDTHPALHERLSALGTQPQMAPQDDVAGEVLLGEAWPRLVAELDEHWKQEHKRGWLAAHVRKRLFDGPLLAAEAVTRESWGADNWLGFIRAQASEETLADTLQALRERFPTDRRICHAALSARLASGDERAVADLEQLAREDARFRLSIFSQVAEWYAAQGQRAAAERWQAWADQVHVKVAMALDEYLARAEKQSNALLLPTALPVPVQSVIAEMALHDPCVAGYDLLMGTLSVEFAADRPACQIMVNVLALSLHTDVLRQRNIGEEAAAQPWHALLRDLIPVEQHFVVRTFYVTEPMPPVYARLHGSAPGDQAS